MRRLGNQQRGLIEALHTVQEAFGYLDVEALRARRVVLGVQLQIACKRGRKAQHKRDRDLTVGLHRVSA